MVLGKEEKGLYCLDTTLEDKNISTKSQDEQLLKGTNKPISNFVACLSTTELWHFWLGHPSFEMMQFLDLSSCNKLGKDSIC